jgi:fluoroquinolone transport system permease protein
VKRFAATARLDMRLQARNKLYLFGIIVAVALGLVMRYALAAAAVAVLLPGLWLGAIGSTTFMFVAGMILFEKGERTLDALIVTPLPVRAYLTSKVVTLAGFAMVESLIVLLLAHGLKGVSLPPLLLGIASLGVLYTLAAIGLAVSQVSVTDFLVPNGILALTLLQVPALDAFGVWSHPLLYLFPTEATVVLMKGGFTALAPWQWAYGVGYSLLSIAAAAWWARGRFQRYVVERAAA